MEDAEMEATCNYCGKPVAVSKALFVLRGDGDYNCFHYWPCIRKKYKRSTVHIKMNKQKENEDS